MKIQRFSLHGSPDLTIELKKNLKENRENATVSAV